jgi:hypothetical protein
MSQLNYIKKWQKDNSDKVRIYKLSYYYRKKYKSQKPCSHLNVHKQFAQFVKYYSWLEEFKRCHRAEQASQKRIMKLLQ